jgi:hypothetical protein
MKPRRIAAIAIGALLYLGIAWLLTASAAHIDTDRGSAAAAGMVVVQADEDTQANEQVPSDEIKKYVAVYIAMQSRTTRSHVKRLGKRWRKAPSKQRHHIPASRHRHPRHTHSEADLLIGSLERANVTARYFGELGGTRSRGGGIRTHERLSPLPRCAPGHRAIGAATGAPIARRDAVKFRWPKRSHRGSSESFLPGWKRGKGAVPQDYDELYKNGAAGIFGPGSVLTQCALRVLELLGADAHQEQAQSA